MSGSIDKCLIKEMSANSVRIIQGMEGLGNKRFSQLIIKKGVFCMFLKDHWLNLGAFSLNWRNPRLVGW
jgi:hypothetical protein